MYPRPSQSPSHRPQTTAHLAQTMTLLGLSFEELQQQIESELAKNPALELIDERRCPTCNRRLRSTGPCPTCSLAPGAEASEPVVFVSTKEDFHFGTFQPSEEFPEDDFSSQADDLPTYVLRQIAPELDPNDRRLAVHILNSLDEDGLLDTHPVEIARYHHVPLSRVSGVLRLIQFADPVGVGSLSTQEAMLVQVEALRESRPVPPLADQAIQAGLKHLSLHQYGELAKLLNIPAREARQLAAFIAENLNPFPARAHWGDIRQAEEPTPPLYRRPDIIINQQAGNPDGPLMVEILLPISGTLRISPLFRESLPGAPEGLLDRWKGDLENANLLVKCLRQRNHTMVRLMRTIVKIQRKFILHGDEHLKPITRVQLARALEVHESTISRAVSNKCTQLPNGKIIPLSMFFDRSLAIRATLKQIIAAETKPLSDTQLAKLLACQGHNVARRTVAKYRSMEGILPAHLRQKTNGNSAS